MSDELQLLPEDKEKTEQDKFWKVLIVDDEKDVHEITKLVLNGFSYKNRGIIFLSAFSKKEGVELIDEHPDVALILLDVVMEKDASGLELVNYIRKEKNLNELRIILRTGQPGVAPERKVIDTYDIDGYKTKSELTTDKLYTAVRSGLKNYYDIISAQETQKKLIIAETTAELRETLTSMIIHDLKNPLSIIQSIFSLWKTNNVFRDEKKTQEQFDLVCRASETFSEMVLEQLKLSQLESGKYIPEYEVVDVNQLIHLIYSNSANEFSDNLQFEYYAQPKDFPKLYLDRELFRRIIINLLSNAVRYTREGKIEIHCQYEEEHKTLLLSVKDTGMGIKKEDLPRLFDRFYQAEKSMKQKCTFGIGLSFCDFAVKAMEGEITVESEYGEGSEFKVSIPARKGTGACLPIEGNEEQDKKRRNKTKKLETDDETKETVELTLRVLLVDDSKTIRRIMKMFLNKMGVVNIDEARNGQFAVERVSEKEYDVIFLDITMPVMTGLDVVTIVRPKHPELPIIMLTAEHMKQDEAKNLDVSAFITKPFCFDEIFDTLKTLNLIH